MNLQGNKYNVNGIQLILSGKHDRTTGSIAIGTTDNDLLFDVKEDKEYFKNITTNKPDNSNSKLKYNIVIMGHNTWLSIPDRLKPLSNRINIILTRNNDKLKQQKYPWRWSKLEPKEYYMSFDKFIKMYTKTNADVFVIGGKEIYNLFFLGNGYEFLVPNKILLTEIRGKINSNIGVTLNGINKRYKLTHVSEKIKSVDRKSNNKVSLYMLEFTKTNLINGINQSTSENEYMRVMNKILDRGIERIDRTGVGTISIFGESLEFDISETIPLMTTRHMPWRMIIEELLFFMKGNTDTKLLEQKNINIWKSNTTREFLDKRGLNHYKEGIMGPGYGFQYRHYNANYSQLFADTSKVISNQIGGTDQIKYIENLLQNDPTSRRIMVNAWNPSKIDEMALPPCHLMFQFYVVDNKLNCIFYSRSSDFNTAGCFNVIYYTVLTYILAKRHNLIPNILKWVIGDAHIYKPNIEKAKEQLTRSTRALPKLILNDKLKTVDWQDMDISMFDVVGYFPHKPIDHYMAV